MFCLAFLLAMSIVISVHPASAQTTVAADKFVDSVGVNVHLHYEGTVYRDNFELIKGRLLELGTRHVRDGLIDTSWQGYYDRHKALGQAGIKGIFISSPGIRSAALESYPSRMQGAFEGYEAPNEYNWSGDPAWVATLRNTLTQLHALKAMPALAAYPIYGPSLTEQSAYGLLGNVGHLIDRGNLHNYFAGREPGTPGWGADGYGSIEWNLRNARPYADGKPIVTTETGYSDDPSRAGHVPPSIAAIYTPRVVLEQYLHGIERTYIYELCDPEPGGGADAGYGLLHRDGSPKPAFTALKNLLTLLADPGPAHAVQPLNAVIDGGGANLHRLAFQKRDGSYYLALWVEASVYDVDARTPVAVPVQSVTVRVPSPLQIVAARQWDAEGRVTTTPIAPPAGGGPVTVGDRLLVLEIRDVAPQAPRNLRLQRP